MQLKFESTPSYCQQLHLHRSAAKMTSIYETTRTLRYGLQSREIYIEEPITGNTIGALPDAGWNHQLHPGDTEQPIQAGPLGNALHAPYK